MRVLVILYTVVALGAAECQNFGFGGYSGSAADCFCTSQQTARATRTVGRVSFFPRGQFSTGGCSYCPTGPGDNKVVFPISKTICASGSIGINCNPYIGSSAECTNFCTSTAARLFLPETDFRCVFFPRGTFSSGGCTVTGSVDPCRAGLRFQGELEQSAAWGYAAAEDAKGVIGVYQLERVSNDTLSCIPLVKGLTGAAPLLVSAGDALYLLQAGDLLSVADGVATPVQTPFVVEEALAVCPALGRSFYAVIREFQDEDNAAVWLCNPGDGVFKRVARVPLEHAEEGDITPVAQLCAVVNDTVFFAATSSATTATVFAVDATGGVNFKRYPRVRVPALFVHEDQLLALVASFGQNHSYASSFDAEDGRLLPIPGAPFLPGTFSSSSVPAFVSLQGLSYQPQPGSGPLVTWPFSGGPMLIHYIGGLPQNATLLSLAGRLHS